MLVELFRNTDIVMCCEQLIILILLKQEEKKSTCRYQQALSLTTIDGTLFSECWHHYTDKSGTNLRTLLRHCGTSLLY